MRDDFDYVAERLRWLIFIAVHIDVDVSFEAEGATVRAVYFRP